jgi:hypothetical protein
VSGLRLRRVPDRQVSRTIGRVNAPCLYNGSAIVRFDGVVNSPISALRFSALSLRRTLSTPHSTRFERLELGLFTKPSIRMTSYEFIGFTERLKKSLTAKRRFPHGSE